MCIESSDYLSYNTNLSTPSDKTMDTPLITRPAMVDCFSTIEEICGTICANRFIAAKTIQFINAEMKHSIAMKLQVAIFISIEFVFFLKRNLSMYLR